MGGMVETVRRRPWIRAVHAVLSGLLTGLLAAGPAAAKAPLRLAPQTFSTAAPGSPRVLVVAVPLEPALEPLAPRLAYVGEQAVARSGRFEVLDLTKALDVEGTRVRAAMAEEAAGAFKEGKHAYDSELDTQKALKAFKRAARGYEGSDLLTHFSTLTQARVMEVASQVANGETKAAELEAERLIGTDPQARFSPNYFPPEFITFVEAARETMLANTDGVLEVKTGGVPAQVFVDGQYRGVSPVKVSGLTRAEHVVTVLAPGYAVAQEWAREGELNFTLEPVEAAPRLRAALERITQNPSGPGRDAAALELGASLGAQQVLLLLARGGSLNAPVAVTALRLDVTDGHSLGYAVGNAPTGEGFEGAVETVLASVVGVDAPRVDGKPVTHFGGGSTTSIAERTTGYVLMTTGVALLAGGIYFGLEASSRADRFGSLAQTDGRADKVRSQGKTFALIADVGMVAGLASAGVGTWLAFFKGRDSERAAKPAAAVEPKRPEPVREAQPAPPPPKAVEPPPAPAPVSDPAPASTPRKEDDAEKKRRPSIDDDDLRNY